MELARYHENLHKHYIKDWLSARNLDLSVLEDLPEIGFLVLWEGSPIAAGFIRKIEGNHALLDGYITNPDAPSEDRDIALDILTAKLVSEAKTKGFKQLLALTVHDNISTRAVRSGFKLQEHVFLVKTLDKVTH